MGNFNRDRGGSRSGGPARYASRSEAGGGRSWERRGPVEMHQAVCDNCKKSCEVPFRPTSGKPIFCSSCFEGSRGSDSRRFSAKGGPASGWEGRSNDRPMFDAVCADCGNTCKVPFQPSGEKPVFCSNCFGDKKEGGDRNRERSQPQPQYNDQFEQLNIKLDRILTMLAPAPEETKVAKKKSSKKK